MLQRTADDAIESGELARDVAEAAVRSVHSLLSAARRSQAVTVFGFVARKPEG
jgi:hypothetical protein